MAIIPVSDGINVAKNGKVLCNSTTYHLFERYFIGELNRRTHVNSVLIKMKINTRCVNFPSVKDESLTRGVHKW